MVSSILVALGALAVVSILFLLFFYRDPERTVPSGKNLVSPADGKVTQILDIKNLKQLDNLKIKKGLVGKIRTNAEEITKDGYLISIFMNPLNVHVNRSPIGGKIISVTHTKGGFKQAWKLEALENERTETIIENKDIGRIKVMQIAGTLCRRIDSYITEKHNVHKGERIGMIKLGSQVSLIIPKMELKIIKGQRVKAGETIIASYDHEKKTSQ